MAQGVCGTGGDRPGQPALPAGPFARALLAWYEENRRTLPWREGSDPYRIWISEVMLQQTRVESVIPYYRRFLERFPTLAALAAAPEEEVLKAWEGLGYYSRARNLRRAAREVAERFGGRLPASREELASLPGIGAYTAGAVASIAFGRAEPALDGNAVRVLARFWAVDQEVNRASVRRLLEERARALVPSERPGDFNQALMELGARVCTPAAPRCGECPLASWCEGHKAGRERDLPRKGPRRSPRRVERAVGLVIRPDGRVLVSRRPEGLLGGLWEFPGVERAARQRWEEALAQGLAAGWGLDVEVGPCIDAFSHVFSHLRWEVRAFLCRTGDGPGEGPGPQAERTAQGTARADVRWAARTELRELPFGKASSRLARRLEGGGELGPLPVQGTLFNKQEG